MRTGRCASGSACIPARRRVDEGYVGIDVHVAARIAAAGNGGQILLSRQTRGLVPDELVRDLGVHRLKDVGEVQLYQYGYADFPPVRSIGRSTSSRLGSRWSAGCVSWTTSGRWSAEVLDS